MRHCALTPLLFLLATLDNPCTAAAAMPERLDLGRTSTGATASLIGSGAGWSIEIDGPGSLLLSQAEPARVEISDGSGGMHEFNAAYSQVSRTPDGVEAFATVCCSSTVSFLVRLPTAENSALLHDPGSNLQAIPEIPTV